MRVFTYSPQDLGLDRWPEGELRLEGSIPVTDPSEADVFICPAPLSLAHTYGLDRLPFMKDREDRHVFLDVSDHFTDAIGKRCLFIRCNMRSWMKEKDPNSIAFAWPVEDYAECVEVPEGGFKYDVSFHGWLSTDTRIQSSNACLGNRSLNCDIRQYSDFTGYIYFEPEGIRRRAEFRRSMRESRVCLCPESIPGVLPYRFFEAMSAGRVPVLVSSDYVLPFADEIPYDDFMLEIDRDNSTNVGLFIRQFLDRTPDDELVRMGRLARMHWLESLNSADWPRMMTYAVERKLREVLV